MLPVLLVVGSWIAAPTIAAAHDELLSTQPANQAVLKVAPSQLVVTFEEAPLAGTTKVAASSASGTVVSLAAPLLTGAVVTVPWPTGTAAGSYVVSWRNVGADGHPLQGQFSFSYANSAAAPTESAPATDSPSPSVSPVSTGSQSSWLLPTLAGVVVLIITIIALMLSRRRSQNS